MMTLNVALQDLTQYFVQGEIKGQWGGITIPIVLEFYDGFIHFDYEYQAMQPETLTPYVFTLPDPKSLF